MLIWRTILKIKDLLKKSREEEPFTKSELVQMLSYPADSPESYRVMAEANRLSKELTQNQAEVHAQLALNLAPCPCNCQFCSFAESNGIFKEETRLSPEQAVRYAKQFEAEGSQRHIHHVNRPILLRTIYRDVSRDPAQFEGRYHDDRQCGGPIPRACHIKSRKQATPGFITPFA